MVRNSERAGRRWTVVEFSCHDAMGDLEQNRYSSRRRNKTRSADYTGDTDLAMTPPRIYRPHPGELWQSDCFSVGHTLSVFQRQSGITQSPCIDNVFLWYKLQHLLAGQVGALLVAQTYPDGLKRRGRTLLNSSVSDQDQFTRHAFRERWLVAQS